LKKKLAQIEHGQKVVKKHLGQIFGMDYF